MAVLVVAARVVLSRRRLLLRRWEGLEEDARRASQRIAQRRHHLECQAIARPLVWGRACARSGGDSAPHWWRPGIGGWPCDADPPCTVLENHRILRKRFSVVIATKAV